MNATQKEQFLSHIRSGSGRAFACTQVKVTLKDLKAELRTDPAFMDAMETEEQAYNDLVSSIIGNDALNGSVSSAAAWLNYQHRVLAFKLERAKLAPKKKEVFAKAKAVDHITTDHATARLKLKHLDNAEFARYCELQGKVSSCNPLDDDEAMEYGRLVEMAHDTEQSATKSLNGLAKVDNMFDSDDDEEDWDA